MVEFMQKVFINPEQLKVLEHPNIVYAGKKIVRFDNEILFNIKSLCLNNNDIRTLLVTSDIPRILLLDLNH